MLARRDDTFWAEGAPQLLALLAASAPRLRSLECRYPPRAPNMPASALPALIGQLSQLTRLSLDTGSGCITIAQVDVMVQELPLLQHLSISHGKGEFFFLSLAGIIRSCSRLVELRIQGAYLGTIPAQLGALSALTKLGLSGSRITSLPGSVWQLTSLREVHLNNSGLLQLPPQLTACQQLTQLAMICHIQSPLLGSLRTLRRLSIACGPTPNELTPDTWPKLTGLMELELWFIDSCPIPAGLGGMTGLRTLRIIGGDGDTAAKSLARRDTVVETTLEGMWHGRALCQRSTKLQLEQRALRTPAPSALPARLMRAPEGRGSAVP